MKLQKQITCIAATLCAFVSLATLTSAMASSWPAAPASQSQTAELPPPVQTVAVTRGASYKDLNVMKGDDNARRLSAEVAAILANHVDPISVDALSRALDAAGWTIDFAFEDEWHYYYWIDPVSGNVRRFCYIEGELYVDDGQETMLRVELRTDEEI